VQLYKKQHVKKVAHVEAGIIRSGDWSMLEINRLVTDEVTNYFFYNFWASRFEFGTIWR
jgi:UDP-N-acetylglucosamine 2-epimerase